MSSTPESQPTASSRCPVCGVGTLADLAFDNAPETRRAMQTAESRQLTAYSCGHQVQGPSLASADEDSLDVERRSAEETVDPPVSDPDAR